MPQVTSASGVGGDGFLVLNTFTWLFLELTPGH